MATRLYGVLLDGLKKPIINATVVLLAKGNTITVLNGSEAIFKTDAQGAYNVTVQSGYYKVIIGPQGIEPYKAGEIAIYADSPEGSLNSYLVNWAEEDLTPEVIKQVKELVAVSEEYALQAGRSAAAAQSDATDARNSKASAAQSASDALVHKNDSKVNADAAKQAQAGAAGSANTASAALTTIQDIQKDVTASKDRAVTAETNAKSSEDVATQAKTDAVTAKEQAVEAKNKAQQLADSIDPQSIKNSIGLGLAPRDCPDISGNPSGYVGFMRIMSTATGFPSIASGESSLTGYISQVDGTPAYTGVFQGWATRSLYTYRWNPTIGPEWTRHARKNEVDKLVQLDLETHLLNPDGKAKIFITSNKSWGAYDNENRKYIPLAIAQGGTGAATIDGARSNLGLGRDNSPQLNSLFLDRTSNSTAGFVHGGTLNTRLLGTDGIVRLGSEMYVETLKDEPGQLTIKFTYNGSTGASRYLNFNSKGELIVDSAILKSTVGKPLQINSSSPAIRFNETDRPANTPAYTLIADRGNWFIRKSDYDNAGSTSTAISYDFENDRLDVQNLKATGLITADSGIATLSSSWSTQHTDNVAKFKPIAGDAGGPSGATVVGGFHVQFSSNYATQFAGRNSSFWARSFEAGVDKGWKRLLTVDDLNSLNVQQVVLGNVTLRQINEDEGTGIGVVFDGSNSTENSFGIVNTGGGSAVFHNYTKPANSSAVNTGVLIGGYGSRPWTGSTYTEHSNVSQHFLMDGVASATNHGGWFRLLTTPLNATVDERRQTFATSNNGDLYIGYDVPMGLYKLDAANYNGLDILNGRGLKQVNNTANEIALITPRNGSTANLNFRGVAFDGSMTGAKGATQQGDNLWLSFAGHDGVKFTGAAAGIRIQASSGWSTTNHQCGITFATTTQGSTKRTDRWAITSDGTLSPAQDNTYAIGSSVSRATSIFATNGAIQTSDARMKTDVRKMSDAELSAAKDIAREFGFFQWIERVKTEGESARWHAGITVQRVISIMSSYGLDPMAYGFVCYDSWEEQEVVSVDPDNQSKTITKIEAGDRYSLRYSELSIFIARGLEQRISELEDKLL